MTTVWTALIVVGLVLIGLAVWPSIRDRKRTPSASDPAAEAEAARSAADHYGKRDGGVGGGSV
ncbi:hypothetical protein ACWKSP_08540 [Micromonosporaceae bacterium Da 78-11]